MKAPVLILAGVLVGAFAGLHARQAYADPMFHVLSWQQARQNPSRRAWLRLALAGIELPEAQKD